MSKLKQFIGLIFLISQFFILVVHSQNIVLFDNSFHQGQRTILNVSSCTNLPKEMEKKVTAIDTKGNCIRFYAEHDCKGKFIEVLPRSPSHHFLGDWGFNDVTVSVGPCRDQCSVNVTGPVPSKENGINITVFDRTNFQGAMETINVKGCTLIPRKLNYNILSVNTTSDDGHCFQLYNNIECQKNWTAGQDSIELRQGSPFHNDLRRWLFPISKAISHCSYKCGENNLSPEKTQPRSESTIQNPVILYDEINFRGNGLLVQIPNKGILGDCLNLDQFDGWEGATASLKFYLNQSNCLLLFGATNCTGHLQLKLDSSVKDLSLNKFLGMTRSLKFCDPNKIPTFQKHSGKNASTNSVSRFVAIMLLIAGFLVGIIFLVAIIGKWYYPNMNLRNAVLGRFGNEMGFSGPNVSRL